MKNNLGQELTEDQATYFHNSKVVDDKGNLLVCYHGTPVADFLTFDPRNKGRGNYKYNSKVVNFFASTKEQAKSYGGSDKEVDLKNIKGNKDSGIYSVYLDIENPYIYDAKGSNWRALHDENIRKNIIDRYNLFLQNCKKYYFDSIKDHLDALNDILRPMGYILKYYEDDYYDLYSLVEGGQLDPVDNRMRVDGGLATIQDLAESEDWKTDIIGDSDDNADPYDNNNYYYSTNDIINYAINTGAYDGVIIENVEDSGQYGWADVSTIYITIKSPNQIKSINNEHPSGSDNINESKIFSMPQHKLDYINNNSYFKGYKLKSIPLDTLIKDNNLDNPDELSYHDEWANGEDESGNPTYNIKSFHYDPSKDTNRGDIIYATMKNGKIILANGKHRIKALANDGYDNAIILLKEVLNESDFDYHTGTVNGNNIFDTSTLGGFSGIADTIPGSKYHQYMIDEKNMLGTITQMSPNEYYDICAHQIFNTTTENLKQQRTLILSELDELKDVILNRKKQFPMCFIDYTDRSQEGLHRMYVAGELFGWDTKFPVLEVRWADVNRHIKDVKRQHEDDMKEKIDEIFIKVEHPNYEDKEDVLDNIKYYFDPEEGYTITSDDKGITVSKEGVSVEKDWSEFSMKLPESLEVSSLDINKINNVLKDRFEHQFYYSDKPQDGPCDLFSNGKFLYFGDANKNYLFHNMELDYLVEIGEIKQEDVYTILDNHDLRKQIYPYIDIENTLILNDGFYRSEECIIRLSENTPTEEQYGKLDEWLDHVRLKSDEVQVAYRNKDLNFITYNLTDPDIDNKYIIGRIKLSYINHKLLP